MCVCVCFKIVHFSFRRINTVKCHKELKYNRYQYYFTLNNLPICFQIFDAFKSRLHDSNSKVNLVALETMHKMIPLIRDNLSPIINMLIPAIVDNNLNSKNPGIYAAATNVIQALIQHVGKKSYFVTHYFGCSFWFYTFFVMPKT